jgi:hypothetical protein
MRTTGLVLWLLIACAASAAAQTIEVSASVGRACRGSDGSFCYEDWTVSRSVEAGLMLRDKFQMIGRWGEIPMPDRGTPLYQPLTIAGQRRDPFYTAEFLYHFRPDKPVRAFIGGGIGRMARVQTVRCAVPGCNPGDATLGRSEIWRDDQVLAAGVLFLPLKSLPIRAGLRLHMAFGEGHQQELFLLSVGYRFGR